MSSGGLKLPKGWEVKRLEEVCEVEYGTRVVRKRDGGAIFPVYGGGGATFFMDTFNRENCLVVARFAMSEKCTRFVKGKLFLNDSGLSVKAKNDKETNQEFLNLQFLHLNDYIYSLARGTAQKNLNVPVFRKLEIYYPKSLKEQKRIVTILDKSFAEIAKAETIAKTNLQNAKELFESYLDNVFKNKSDDWKEKLLGDICKIESKLIDPKELKYQDFIHIGAGNIVSEKGMLIDLKTAKEEALISGKFLFDDSMVLYSKIRPYLMKIVKCEFKGLCSADIYPLTPIKGKLVQSFLYYLLLSSHFTKYAIEGSQRAGMPKVNRKHLFNYSFYCPLAKQQKQIVQKLDQLQFEIKKLEKIYQQKNESLIALRKSILQKAFEGEL
ncbi:restriction endonuclease subunit S [Bathymodiolus thermophilus thioautotrophic gill symbiont]|uniref:Type I restriction-modification system, specificity subunit S n=1 Tax=Bathymodiolus thermophilus thioautotrophic gill symbiont TaxID=2360 RepID=A0A8H8XC35_9GAMM|nr:restriction endonuclease subunit S [Bathymodiolus thermophilus thioautotrophic gill symbiont]CAB5496210.1 Type I restriction-modification system, specificity subunit S [Bathymodiolus thermophilus thioautotrophic gill symbiont]